MAEEASEEKSSSGGSMIKIIIIVVVILVAGGGGFVGWTLMNRGEDPSKEAVESTPQFNVNATPITYSLDTYIVNLMGKTGMSKKYLKVGIMLGISSEEQKSGIDQYKPLINDSVLILLSSKTYNELGTVEGKIQLKQELIMRMNQVLGVPMVKKIYFTEFVVQ
ncbi:flagellar basal body-associated FliL family protein [Desulfocicer niacini]